MNERLIEKKTVLWFKELISYYAYIMLLLNTTYTIFTQSFLLRLLMFLLKGFLVLQPKLFWKRHRLPRYLSLWYAWCPDCTLAKSSSTSLVSDSCSSSSGWKRGGCDQWQTQGELSYPNTHQNAKIRAKHSFSIVE